MTNPHLDQALEWVKYAKRMGTTRKDARAAIDLIESLPDHWIDAKELRKVIEEYDSWESGALIDDLRALLTPPLPTLADMTPEERKACQWMQAKIHGSDELVGVIFFLTDDRAKILFRDGTFFTQDHEDITPIPGPKLKWPGSPADTITTETTEGTK